MIRKYNTIGISTICYNFWITSADAAPPCKFISIHEPYIVMIKSYTIAYTGCTILTSLQGVNQRDDNPRSGVTNGVAEGDGTTVHIKSA